MRPLVIFLLGFLARAILVATNPMIWGGDTVIRLFDRHTLVKAHQLPMLQLLISGVSRISMDPLAVQILMAAIGAAAGVGFYLVAADLFGEKPALPAALLFVSHPYILAVSTVPFQEILMLAGLLFAFHFFYTERWAAASVCLAVACLTRYEAWVACPVMAAWYVWRTDRRPVRMLQAVVLFCWLPAVWIAGRHGLTAAGHFAVELPASLWRLQRYVYLGWITVKFTQVPVLLLAAAALWRLRRERARIGWRLWMQMAFVALFTLVIPFSAHGVLPDPERYVTSREAHLWMYFALLLAAYGLAQWPGWSRAIVASSLVLGSGQTFWYVRVETSPPEVQLAYELARFLDHSLRDGERAVIFAKPVGEDVGRLYLEKAFTTGGEEGLRQARLELREMAATPPDYQRVVVMSRLGRERLLTPPACADWVAVWSNSPDSPGQQTGDGPVRALRSGWMSVNVFRRRC